MSSPTPTRSDRLPARAAALLLALVLAAWPVPAGAAAAVPLPIVAVLTVGGQTYVVVDLSATPASARRSVAVTTAGTREPADLVPVFSGDLAVSLVVDASKAGAAALPAWLSAAARFALEAPDGARAAAIADSTPAAMIAGPRGGAVEMVRALHRVGPGGGRDTAAALDLAARQFPDAPPGRRVVLLYTTATGAGGEGPAALAARFRAAGTILVVVGTAEGAPYWTGAAAATGGFFAPAGDPVVVPALDQVRTTLAGRYLVRFRTPPALPAWVSVRIAAGGLTLDGNAVVTAPPPAAASPRPPGRPTVFRWLLLVAGVLALAAATLLGMRPLRPPAGPAPPGAPVRAPAPDPGPGVAGRARGRAAVPGPVARGRAVVPPSSRAAADRSRTGPPE
jgi:hypothetical protein